MGASLVENTGFNGGLVGLVGLNKVCLFERPHFSVHPVYIVVALHVVIVLDAAPSYV